MRRCASTPRETRPATLRRATLVLALSPTILVFVSVLASCVGSGCSRAPAPGADRPVIAVSIAPQHTLVTRLVGSHASVLVLLPAGSNPSVYEPDARRTLQLSRARLYFTAGVPFERGWLSRFVSTNPNLRVVDTNKGIPVSGHDPHTYLAPPLVARQVALIEEALVKEFPQAAADIRRNSVELRGEIDALHRSIAEELRPHRGKTFLVMHPSWNYFAETYQIRMLAIEHEGREPGPAHLARVLAEARRLGIKTVFAQPEYDLRPARVVARELGAEVVTFSPLDEDWNGMLRKFSATLARVLR